MSDKLKPFILLFVVLEEYYRRDTVMCYQAEIRAVELCLMTPISSEIERQKISTASNLVISMRRVSCRLIRFVSRANDTKYPCDGIGGSKPAIAASQLKGQKVLQHAAECSSYSIYLASMLCSGRRSVIQHTYISLQINSESGSVG